MQDLTNMQDLTTVAIKSIIRYLEFSRELPRGYNTIFHDTCYQYYMNDEEYMRLQRTLMNDEGELMIKLECDANSELITLSQLESELLEPVKVWLEEKEGRVVGCRVFNELTFFQGKKPVVRICLVERTDGSDYKWE
jgi:hypothetical protein